VKPTARTRPARVGIALVGPGRLGQALGRLLTRAGYPVRFVAARRLARARRAARFIGGGRPLGMQAPELTSASVILLTTSDAAIAQVARELAALSHNWSGSVVLHTCGSLPAAVLKPLALRGAAIGSLHPFQTIPNPATGVRNLVGCFWAIEGDPAARKIAIGWVRALKGVAFPVGGSRRTLYHLAAFLVSPTTVTLMDHSFRLLRRLGVPARIARPMLGLFVGETVRNFVELGARRALTGPASRGDWRTIRRHLQALRRESPKLIPVYKALLNDMLRLAGRWMPGGRDSQEK
jgi:predicted short-subunit dehydrogenase-like oxidoreductase (DUF2520 family)